MPRNAMSIGSPETDTIPGNMSTEVLPSGLDDHINAWSSASPSTTSAPEAPEAFDNSTNNPGETGRDMGSKDSRECVFCEDPENATSYNETLYTWNGSLANETFYVQSDSIYPSGYTLTQIIVAAVVVTMLMIVIVVGNMLVIVAIATEKSLKNIQNWFIASLAVSDFFLGLVVMPFSLANEIMGYWIFGYWWCEIYSAMDVLLCTASIMNLCLIGLDRYWSITKAVDYLKERTPARAILMITLVWLLSALVCIPPLLGWKRPAAEEEFPKCTLSEDIGYVLYSAIGSFYLPSSIMLFVYVSIYYAAKARARRRIQQPVIPKPTLPIESPDVRQTSFTLSSAVTDQQKAPGLVLESVATIENQPIQIPIVTCDFASDASTSDIEHGGASVPMEMKDTLKAVVCER